MVAFYGDSDPLVGFDHNRGTMDLLPSRIVCLTEETTEWLYLLGQEHRIVGISGYTVRPKIARAEKPRVSSFTSAKIDKILALQPDCVLGFSDLQADIASTLIRQGVQVTIFNQRSVAEILSMLYQVGAMVGQAQQAMERIAAIQASKAWAARPENAAKLEEFTIVSVGNDSAAQIAAISAQRLTKAGEEASAMPLDTKARPIDPDLFR